MTNQLVPPVESSGVGAQEPFHPRHQIDLGRLHHQVKVVGHETEWVTRLRLRLISRLTDAFHVRQFFKQISFGIKFHVARVRRRVQVIGKLHEIAVNLAVERAFDVAVFIEHCAHVDKIGSVFVVIENKFLPGMRYV